jgi:uncharacterized tellurite resistance protein B-like protein
MFTNLFKKKNSKTLIEKYETDVVLRLMFEIAISDGKLDKSELDLIKKRADQISDTDEKAPTIVKRIIDETQNASSLYPTVQKINEDYELDEKKSLLKTLWELVAADQIIDPYEESLYFRIADLIKVKRSHANQIKQENS